MIIENKVIWITGASSGIGEALAHQAAREGAKVVISARNKEKLQTIANQISRENCLILPLDMTDKDSFQKAIDTILEKWGRIDILVNNAGVSQRATVAESGIKIIEKVMNTNFMGPAGLTSLVIPHMIRQKSGYCLFVSSIAGKFATPLRSSYAASKMALQGFSDALRAEVYEHNIRVSLIVPGFVKTSISLNSLDGEGNRRNIMDPNQARGISPEQAAIKILHCIKKEKREIYMGMVAKTYIALFLSKYFPGRLAKIMRKAEVK
ncbi:MAG: SDR family oxidoreductase [Spirochaetales bacterium]|nr:SDR family oxidoreductase [Spirochaetales bacterium]